MFGLSKVLSLISLEEYGKILVGRQNIKMPIDGYIIIKIIKGLHMFLISFHPILFKFLTKCLEL